MKPKILGTGNKDRYSYFIFLKEQSLLQSLRKILLELGEIEIVVDTLIYQGGLCSIEEAREKGKKLDEKDYGIKGTNNKLTNPPTSIAKTISNVVINVAF